MYARLDAARDPARDMAELLRLRAREGAVYHHAFQLEGRSLSDWLAECRTDPVPLLGALARSRLVRPGRSTASPLVNGLSGEGGAMFRVFAPAELAVIRRWIDALPAASAEAPMARAARARRRSSCPHGKPRPTSAERPRRGCAVPTGSFSPAPTPPPWATGPPATHGGGSTARGTASTGTGTGCRSGGPPRGFGPGWPSSTSGTRRSSPPDRTSRCRAARHSSSRPSSSPR